MREVGADGLDRIVRLERTRAAGDLRPTPGAFAELAVTGGALRDVDLLSGLHRALAGRQSPPVRTHVDVPAGDRLGCCGLADVELAFGGGCWSGHEQQSDRRNNQNRCPPPTPPLILRSRA